MLKGIYYPKIVTHCGIATQDDTTAVTICSSGEKHIHNGLV
jgi:hypothetical protein